VSLLIGANTRITEPQLRYLTILTKNYEIKNKEKQTIFKAMSRVFFISDLHLGHKNMAIKRGFKDEVEHDNHIISQWNKAVGKRDTVWILGDITMEKTSPYPLLNSLNGLKKVVLGNHDRPNHIPELLKYVNSVCGLITYKGFVLSHCPIHGSEIGRFRKNIHGHVHEKSLKDSRYINVSCEVVDYTPVLFDKI